MPSVSAVESGPRCRSLGGAQVDWRGSRTDHPLMAAAQRALMVAQSLLRALLGQRVNVMILEKAQELELSHFEDAEFYDKLTRARREASSRPLSLGDADVWVGPKRHHAGDLWMAAEFSFPGSPWSGLLVAALPAFFVETYFLGGGYSDCFVGRFPETRKRNYLEWLLGSRGLMSKSSSSLVRASLFLTRYREIFEKLYKEDKALTLRRGSVGVLAGRAQ